MDEDSSIDVPDGINFSTYFSYIFGKKLYTDVTFAWKKHKYDSGSKTFKAHKLILSIWSPYFADLFFKPDAKLLPDEIDISDVNPDAFEEMIRFMYGYVPSMESPKFACEIHKVAEKFQVAKLIDICQKRINRAMPDVSNVFDTLEAANCMKNENLETRCLSLIRTKTKEILEKHNDYNVSPDGINAILDTKEISLASEYELLSWLFTWAKNEYVRSNTLDQISANGPRVVLIDFFPKMDFLALSSQEFVKLYKEHQGILEEKEALSILMNIAVWESWPMPEWFGGEIKIRSYTGVTEPDSLKKESQMKRSLIFHGKKDYFE